MHLSIVKIPVDFGLGWSWALILFLILKPIFLTNWLSYTLVLKSQIDIRFVKQSKYKGHFLFTLAITPPFFFIQCIYYFYLLVTYTAFDVALVSFGLITSILLVHQISRYPCSIWREGPATNSLAPRDVAVIPKVYFWNSSYTIVAWEPTVKLFSG